MRAEDFLFIFVLFGEDFLDTRRTKVYFLQALAPLIVVAAILTPYFGLTTVTKLVPGWRFITASVANSWCIHFLFPL